MLAERSSTAITETVSMVSMVGVVGRARGSASERNHSQSGDCCSPRGSGRSVEFDSAEGEWAAFGDSGWTLPIVAFGVAEATGVRGADKMRRGCQSTYRNERAAMRSEAHSTMLSSDAVTRPLAAPAVLRLFSDRGPAKACSSVVFGSNAITAIVPPEHPWTRLFPAVSQIERSATSTLFGSHKR